MRRNTPLLTLLTGAALGLSLLVASMLSTPVKAPAGYSAPATPASASTTAAAPPPSSASPSQAATPVATAPTRADYAGRVQDGSASVAISIHSGQAIAYVCNGSSIEGWYKGTATGGVLVMTGKNGARLSAIYDFGKVTGDVLAHGHDYQFAVAVVHKPSGLYQAIAVVRGATIKAGWIVLSDGTQVGSLEPNSDSAAPSATRAPALDVAAGTAQDGDTVLSVKPVSGATGSGF
jgi:hypothetical protein